jgi:hypothetical protein
MINEPKLAVKVKIVLVILGQYLKSEVLTVVNTKSTVFRYVAPYSLLDRLDTVYCFHLQGVRLE